MYCPQCGTEYREGVATCSECGVALEAAPPPEARDEVEWADRVTVLVTIDPALLAIARSLLDAEGIKCFVQGGESQSVFGASGLPGEVGGPMRLAVAREDEEPARALLAAQELASDVPPGEEETNG